MRSRSPTPDPLPRQGSRVDDPTPAWTDVGVNERRLRDRLPLRLWGRCRLVRREPSPQPTPWRGNCGSVGDCPTRRLCSVESVTRIRQTTARQSVPTIRIRTTCDVNGDGMDDIVTGAGATRRSSRSGAHGERGSRVEIASFYAYDPAFTGGVFVASGDVNGDGVAEIITGAGPGGGPHVRAFSLAGGSVVELASFFAYDPAFWAAVTWRPRRDRRRRRRDHHRGRARRRPARAGLQPGGRLADESRASSRTTRRFPGGVTVAAADLTATASPRSSPGPARAAGRTCGPSAWRAARRRRLRASSPTTRRSPAV